MELAACRDEFKRETIRTLQERAGNRCSAPDCRRLTSGPNLQPDKASRIGVAAHITAAAAGGPRFDSSLTPAERSSIRNGIWLCQSCARLVDVDAARYTVLRLVGWKEEAERAALDELEGKRPQLAKQEDAQQDEPDKEGWICPFCSSFVQLQQHVCLGCKSEVIRGATRKERNDAMQTGTLMGGVLAFGLFVILPQWLNSMFDLQIPSHFGLGFFALGLGGGLAILGGFGCVLYQERYRSNQPPRFYRSTVT